MMESSELIVKTNHSTDSNPGITISTIVSVDNNSVSKNSTNTQAVTVTDQDNNLFSQDTRDSFNVINRGESNVRGTKCCFTCRRPYGCPSSLTLVAVAVTVFSFSTATYFYLTASSKKHIR